MRTPQRQHDSGLICHTHVKYLGVKFDQSLSGDGMAENVVSKMPNLKTKKLLVSALIQCHFDYARTSWYSGLTKRYKTR